MTLTRLALLLGAAVTLAACRREAAEPEIAARVADARLTEGEVSEALSTMPPGLDSAAARQQVIEQWVTAELLAQEARRRGLQDEEGVRRSLAESERAVLGGALVEHFFAANPGSPTDEELAAYFEEHRAALTLREPYVRVRLLRTQSQSQAETARASLARAGNVPFADSLWRMVAREYADDPAGALAMSNTYMAESRLRAAGDVLADAAATLGPGQATVIPIAGMYHVLQVVDRQQEGAPARLEWIRDDLRERIAIDRRRALLARQVQSLRTEAMAGGRLDVPSAATADAR